ncbi:DUF262 domain-containing protein [Oceanobacillus sp. Castelsardo]|uniref:DUF262 domain-containing protein n=1 Tax=Oceanobacillus sp. Castelsardo TaxID=1851204 RepID=UPI000838AD64|nr:DUF262 domain-containing protein [Oceanobacillus sp. Castelsardo]
MDVTPDKQNIDKVFSNTTYYIDFYQRQYKWNEEPVKRLLDDIFYKFDIEYEKLKDNDLDIERLIEKFSWYYLNTYVTNNVDGRLYIVDGQQRLTTLTLILMKLKHQASEFHSDLGDWISSKIVGLSGFKKEFWMNHEQHKSAMQDLFDGELLENIDTSSGITAENMVSNYKAISNFLNKHVTNQHKFERFVFYFLKRLVLINLNVEQTDVPMVFEVINDRGIRLKPYEILKGKLLGQIDKEELEQLKLNDIWDNQINSTNYFYDDGIDDFFIYYLRAKFANTIGEARKYDKNYHRTIFQDEVNSQLKLNHNPKSVKKFLKEDFKYYTNLYLKLLTCYDQEDKSFIHVYYNGLTDMDSQFMLIMSACKIDDKLEDEKIKLISYLVDRLYTLLQLQKGYDSNDFQEAMYDISRQIRNNDDLDEIKGIFNKKLIHLITENRGVKTNQAISYGFFRETGNELNKRFKRYFFARIENFIADNTNLNMKHSLYDLVKNTGTVNGFHIEHILSMNSDNLALFDNDEERFERERNRLGGLLLLKGKDNISSNNESYSKKLKSYSNTLYWNETLRKDSYKSKLDFKQMIKKYDLKFEPMDKFGSNELEERQKLLFEIVKIIW